MVTGLCVALAACGVKGDLKRPSQVKADKAKEAARETTPN